MFSMTILILLSPESEREGEQQALEPEARSREPGRAGDGAGPDGFPVIFSLLSDLLIRWPSPLRLRTCTGPV